MITNFKIFIKPDGGLNPSKCSNKLYASFKDEILQKYYWCKSLGESYYCFLNNITQPPICKMCESATTYKKGRGYSVYCSRKCSGKDRNYVSTNEFKNKSKQTNLKKYGVVCYSHLTECKEKQKTTCLEKYGVEYYPQTDECKEKQKTTCLEKYGVDNIFKSKSFINDNKTKVINNWKNNKQEILEKSQSTCQNRYGVKHYTQRHYTEDTINKLSNREWLFDQHHNKNRTLANIGSELKIDASTVGDHFYHHGIEVLNFFSSSYEQEISDFLLSLKSDLEVQRNIRSVIPPFELDIYLPDHKLAIEFNGDFWHTYGVHKKYPKNKHKDKFLACEKQGIQLLQIRESDWINKKEIWKSIIGSKLGFFNRKIFARKCEIKIVSASETKKFLEQNHLQGSTTSKLNYGLYFEDELVMIQTYKQHRSHFELVRMASLLNCQIIGGASRLFSFFWKENNPAKVITFADLEYSVGKIYRTLGFIQQGNTSISYYYFKDGFYYHKRSFQKKKHNIPETITEQQYWLEKGYRIYWNCGNRKFVFLPKFL